MNLEASSVGETGVGMMQIQSQIVNLMMKIQSQIVNLMMQIQDINQGKEVKEEIWCTICRIEGDHKESCPSFLNYLALYA